MIWLHWRNSSMLPPYLYFLKNNYNTRYFVRLLEPWSGIHEEKVYIICVSSAMWTASGPRESRSDAKRHKEMPADSTHLLFLLCRTLGAPGGFYMELLNNFSQIETRSSSYPYLGIFLKWNNNLLNELNFMWTCHYLLDYHIGKYILWFWWRGKN